MSKPKYNHWDEAEVQAFKARNKVEICDFLLNHEFDIAQDINDFGMLKGFFNQVFARDASVSPVESRAKKLG